MSVNQLRKASRSGAKSKRRKSGVPSPKASRASTGATLPAPALGFEESSLGDDLPRALQLAETRTLQTARQAIAAMNVVAEGRDNFILLKRFGVRVDIE